MRNPKSDTLSFSHSFTLVFYLAACSSVFLFKQKIPKSPFSHLKQSNSWHKRVSQAPNQTQKETEFNKKTSWDSARDIVESDAMLNNHWGQCKCPKLVSGERSPNSMFQACHPPSLFLSRCVCESHKLLSLNGSGLEWVLNKKKLSNTFCLVSREGSTKNIYISSKEYWKGGWQSRTAGRENFSDLKWFFSNQFRITFNGFDKVSNDRFVLGKHYSLCGKRKSEAQNKERENFR